MSESTQPSAAGDRERAQARLRTLTRGAIAAAAGATVFLGVVVSHESASSKTTATTNTQSSSNNTSDDSDDSGTTGSTGNTGAASSSSTSTTTSTTTPTRTFSSPTVTSGATS